jgi:signal transduction histidine kinase
VKSNLALLFWLLCAQMCFAQSSDVDFKKNHEANKVLLWSKPEQAIAIEKLLFKDLTSDSLKAAAAQVIAIGYSITSQWDSALTYHYLSLRHAEYAQNSKLLAFAYNNLGLVHLKLQDTLQATIYLDLAEPYMLETSKANELGRFFRSKYLTLPKSKIIEREHTIRRALASYNIGNDSTELIACYVELSELQPDSIHLYIQKADKLLNTLLVPCDEASIQCLKAEEKLINKKPNEAIIILMNALRRSKEINTCSGTEKILLRLSEAYEEIKDFRNARIYLSEYYDLLSEKNRNESKASSSNNYLKLLNAELEKLRGAHNEDLERLSIINLKAEQAELKLTYSKRTNWVILFALACLTILVVILLRMINSKKRKQIELNHGIVKIRTAHEELIASEGKLKSTQLQLIQSEKLNSIGIMVAGVAHEINNPLHYLQSGIYLLRSKEPPFLIEKDRSEFLEILDLMEKGVHEASSIVGNLQQFSRKTDFDTHVKVDLNSTIVRSLQLLEHKILRSVGRILFEPVGKFEILANAESLVQIFVNLISNALHASPKINSISISLHAGPYQTVRVQVKDCGVGISKENLRKIFDPFFTTKPVGEGTGLGLSIVHKLVTEQHGTIEVASTLNEGTTFTLNFSLAS